ETGLRNRSVRQGGLSSGDCRGRAAPAAPVSRGEGRVTKGEGRVRRGECRTWPASSIFPSSLPPSRRANRRRAVAALWRVAEAEAPLRRDGGVSRSSSLAKLKGLGGLGASRGAR